jgi:hypothetical protein
MSHQQSTRCITTLLIIYHLRNRVTIQQTITTLQQIIITLPQIVITLPEDIRLVRKIGQTVKTLLTICKAFNILMNRYNNSLEYIDLSENSQSVANVL